MAGPGWWRSLWTTCWIRWRAKCGDVACWDGEYKECCPAPHFEGGLESAGQHLIDYNNNVLVLLFMRELTRLVNSIIMEW